MDLQDVIALSVVAVAVGFLARKFFRRTKGKDRCHCAGPDAAPAGKGSPDMRPKRLPLVPLEQVGRPDNGSPTRNP